MKIITYLFSILIFSTLILSCSKEEEPGSKYFYSKINEDLYPLLFASGSYWVYTKQNVGSIDSIALIKVDMDTFTIQRYEEGVVDEEQYYDNTYSSTEFEIFHEQLIGYVISRGFIYGGYVYLSSHKIGDETLNAKISEIYDTLTVNGIRYSNVVKMELSQDGYLNSDMNLYYVDSIGVIRKEIKQNSSITETWDLLRFNVNMY